MLRDVISFVSSRSGLTDRAAVLREINFAWKELWSTDDLPGSLFEITVKAYDTRITLPWYVGALRAVKRNCDKARVVLNTPRPYFHGNRIWQSELEWREFGPQPLVKTITNATTLTVKIDIAEETEFTVVLLGPDDNAQVRREEITFSPGETEKTTTYRFSDLVSFTKSVVTSSDVKLIGTGNEEIAVIPNLSFESRYLMVQVKDNCDVASYNYCYDILYKRDTPYLYYDETPVPYQEVLMAKTLEWISLPKDENISKTEVFSEKAGALLKQFNTDEQATDKHLDVGVNPYTTRYCGYL